MRILQLVHQYLPEHTGGVEQSTRFLAYDLRNLGQTVGVVHRANRPDSGWARIEDDISVYSMWAGEMSPTRRFFASFAHRSLFRCWQEILDDFRPDMVHVHHLMGLPVSFLGELRHRGIPFAITLHDYWWICSNATLLTNYSGEACDGPRAYLNCSRCAVARNGSRWAWGVGPMLPFVIGLRNRLLRDWLSAAAFMTAPSEGVRRWYRSQGLASDSIKVLPLGIEVGQPHSEFQRDDGSAVRFLYIGGIAYHKGVHVILEAHRHVAGDSELRIAGGRGDWDYYDKLRHLATSNVRFLGHLSREQIWAELGRASVLLVPSLSPETFGLVVQEAFAAGVPVVASRIGALVESIEHEKNGMLVEPGNLEAWVAAMGSVVRDPRLLTEMRSQIKPPVGTAAYANRMLALYRDTLEKKSQKKLEAL